MKTGSLQPMLSNGSSDLLFARRKVGRQQEVETPVRSECSELALANPWHVRQALERANGTFWLALEAG